MVKRSPSIAGNSLVSLCSEWDGPWQGRTVTDSLIEPEIVSRLRAGGSVFAEEEAALLVAEAADPARLEAMVARRVAGEPLEQIVGWAEFDGLRFVVEPGVFVPRHRTEFLVEQAAAMAGPDAVILDLCCGVGALGVAVRARLAGGVELHSSDVDPAAVRCATLNVSRTDTSARGHVYEGDLFAQLPTTLRGRVELLLANAPYVPTADIALLPPEAREHENRIALDGGSDGLALHRRIIAGAPSWLAPGGRVLIELSEAQAPVAASRMADAGLWVQTVTDADDDDVTTLVIGTLPH
jgi:release factor glutamine methyltransferase